MASAPASSFKAEYELVFVALVDVVGRFGAIEAEGVGVFDSDFVEGVSCECGC